MTDNPTPSGIRSTPLAIVVGVSLTWWLLVYVWPEPLLLLSMTEGPIEHASHVVLLAAAGAWGVASMRLLGRRRRIGRGPSWLAIGLSVLLTLYALLLLLEEIHWGAVYGVDLGHSLLQGWVGGDSLHTAPRTGSAWYSDLSLTLAVPAVAIWCGLPAMMRLWPASERWLAPVTRLRHDTLLFCAVVVLSQLSDIVLPRGSGSNDYFYPDGTPRPDIRSFYQGAVYGVMLLSALRVCRSAAEPVDG